jgi:Metallo-beta-lactamase superfamily
MKVHHLNCGTINAPAAPLVCHVLLVETTNGLVLVDTGFGAQDCADPARRLGPVRHLMRPGLRHEETAAARIERLGFGRDDVRHIVITHFDCDHIGGISDFPDAQIHVTAAEAIGAIRAPSRREKIRYRSAQWAHDPKIVEHSPDGEVAGIRRRQGASRDKPRDRADTNAGPHPGLRVRRGRRRAPVGAALRRRLLPPRHARRPLPSATHPARGRTADRVRPKKGPRQPRPPRRALPTRLSQPGNRVFTRSGALGACAG